MVANVGTILTGNAGVGIVGNPKVVGVSVPWGVAPARGGIMVPMTLAFTNLITTITKDFQQEQSEEAIDFFQSMFIDNTGNAAAPFIISFGPYQPSISGGSRALLPVFHPKGQCQFTAVSNGGNPVTLILYNFLQSPMVW